MATLPGDTLGYEWDEDLDNGVPAARASCGSRPRRSRCRSTSRTTARATRPARRPTTSRSTARASGALVFGAGTVQWTWGLDETHDRGGQRAGRPHAAGDGEPARRHGRAARDAAAELVPASASTDATAPSATIDVAGAGAALTGSRHRDRERHGRRRRRGRRRRGLGRRRRHLAPGGAGARAGATRSTAGAIGRVSVVARAADDSGNLGAASAPVAFDVEAARVPVQPLGRRDGAGRATRTRTTASRSRSASSSGASDDGFVTRRALLQGHARIRAPTSAISGAPAGTAARRGHLQRRERRPAGRPPTFASPVAIDAGATYVASYHSASGYYAFEQGYFAAALERSAAPRARGRRGRPERRLPVRRAGLPDADLPGERLLRRRRLRDGAGLLHRLRRSRRRLRRCPTSRRPADRGRREVPGRRAGQRHRAPLLQGRVEPGHPRRAPLDRRRRAPRDGDLRGRDRLGLAGSGARAARRRRGRTRPTSLPTIRRRASSRSTPATSRARWRHRRSLLGERAPTGGNGVYRTVASGLPRAERQRRELLGRRALRARRALRRDPAASSRA